MLPGTRVNGPDHVVTATARAVLGTLYNETKQCADHPHARARPRTCGRDRPIHMQVCARSDGARARDGSAAGG